MKQFILNLLSESGGVSSMRLGYLMCVSATILLAGCMVWMAFAKLDISYLREISIVALAILGVAAGAKVLQKKDEAKEDEPR